MGCLGVKENSSYNVNRGPQDSQAAIPLCRRANKGLWKKISSSTAEGFSAHGASPATQSGMGRCSRHSFTVRPWRVHPGDPEWRSPHRSLGTGMVTKVAHTAAWASHRRKGSNCRTRNHGKKQSHCGYEV